MKLTRTDMEAVKRGDSNYILNKGANCYMQKDYENAVSYYQLASSMGNIQANCNLAYCHLYGRSVEPNRDLAIAYLELAADRKNIEACYKLGDIYGSDKWGIKDSEMSVYFYRMAASFMIDEDWEDGYAIAYTESLARYPSLCFALGRELMPGGYMRTDLKEAYQFLKQAEYGYRIELKNGADFYEKAYAGVMERINDEIFDEIRDEIDEIFEEDDDEKEYA